MIFVKPLRKINKVFIHCSDSDIKAHDNIETIRSWHVDERGWDDVGYHYFIRKDGTIETGRSLEIQPSAQGKYKGKYHNRGSIAICVSGKDKENFTKEQFDSLVMFCNKINESYNKITFHGHCEVSEKVCPVFDYKEVLQIDDEGVIQLPTLNNILTQPKKKMAFPLLFLAAPLIKKLAIKGFDKLKGKVLDKAKETVISKLLEKTGIDLSKDITPEEAQSKMDIAVNNLSPEQLLEIKKEIIESESELRIAELENQTEQTKIVNQTMKAEIKADDLWQKRWRPFNGFAFAITMLITLITYTVLGGIAIILRSPEMIKMLSELILSTAPIIVFWSGVLGISSLTRGREKIEKLKRLK